MKEIGTFQYSNPNTPIVGIQVVNIGLTFDNSLLVDGIKYFNRRVKIVATTPIPTKLRMSFFNEEFTSMPFIVSDTPTTNHDGIVEFPIFAEGTRDLYVKVVDEYDNVQAFSEIFNITIEASPIGPDSGNLLRLRKFAKNGEIERWGGKDIELP